MSKIKLRINKESLQQLYGVFVTLDVDEHGIPTNIYWRKKLPIALKDKTATIISMDENKEERLCQEQGSPNRQ